MKIKKNGSAIIWAVLAVAMLLIFTTAALTMSFAYSKRSINEFVDRQAYFTARSGVDAIADKITKATQSELNILIPAYKNAKNEYKLDFDENTMGICSATIERMDDTTVKITSIAEKNNQIESVAMLMKRAKSGFFPMDFIGMYAVNMDGMKDPTRVNTVTLADNTKVYATAYINKFKAMCDVSKGSGVHLSRNARIGGGVTINQGIFRENSAENSVAGVYNDDNLPNLPDEFKKISTTLLDTTKSLLDNTWYHIEGSEQNLNCNLKGLNNIYIYMTKSQTLHLKVTNSDQATSVNIYVVMAGDKNDGNDNRSTLSIDGGLENTNLYVYGMDNSTVQVKGTGLDIRGAIFAENIDIYNDFKYMFIPSMEDVKIEDNTYSWEKQLYIKK